MSAIRVSVWPTSQNAPPAMANTTAMTSGPATDFIESSCGKPDGLQKKPEPLRAPRARSNKYRRSSATSACSAVKRVSWKLPEIRHGQLQRQRHGPEARRDEGVAGELRFLRAVQLHVHSSRRAAIDLLDRAQDRRLVARGVELAPGRLDGGLPDVVGQHAAERLVVARADHVDRNLGL